MEKRRYKNTALEVSLLGLGCMRPVSYTHLKRLADDCGVCLLLVHHTRKQQADDKFDMISGTNGLLGAADGAFLLQKEKRTDGSAILDVAGRDQQDQRFYLTKDRERLTWTLERTEAETWTEPPDPVLEAVAALVTAESPSWGPPPRATPPQSPRARWSPRRGGCQGYPSAWRCSPP